VRNISRILDRLSTTGGEIIVERNNRQVARLLPALGEQTALEAMADLYRTLREEAAKDWECDAKRRRFKGRTIRRGVRDPWRS
jgi:antitoxin (DNA-binding transcriptional repressor) of toxin-antitoxin stability system